MQIPIDLHLPVDCVRVFVAAANDDIHAYNCTHTKKMDVHSCSVQSFYSTRLQYVWIHIQTHKKRPHQVLYKILCFDRDKKGKNEKKKMAGKVIQWIKTYQQKVSAAVRMKRLPGNTWCRLRNECFRILFSVFLFCFLFCLIQLNCLLEIGCTEATNSHAFTLCLLQIPAYLWFITPIFM